MLRAAVKIGVGLCGDIDLNSLSDSKICQLFLFPPPALLAQSLTGKGGGGLNRRAAVVLRDDRAFMQDVFFFAGLSRGPSQFGQSKVLRPETCSSKPALYSSSPTNEIFGI